MKTKLITAAAFVLLIEITTAAQDIGITFNKPVEVTLPSYTYQVSVKAPSFTTNYTVTTSQASVTNVFPAGYFALGTNDVTVRLFIPNGPTAIVSDKATLKIIRTSAPAVQILDLSVITRMPGQPWTELKKLPDITVTRTSPLQEFAVIATRK